MADIPSIDEVRKALFLMGPYKSPATDEFHPIFFQKAWDLIGPQVVKFIQVIFSSGQIPDHLNHTIICQIPKKLCPTKVDHFRPISLCNTICKIVTISPS